MSERRKVTTEKIAAMNRRLDMRDGKPFPDVEHTFERFALSEDGRAELVQWDATEAKVEP